MKRWTLAGLLLLCAVVAAHAQSFKLYYANNVTDVTDLDNIEKDTHLNWREVDSNAHISGIQSYGIYCEIDENHCEGMVPMRDLDDDYYDLDEKNYCLVGRRRHHKYQLGDAIRIKVARANLEKRQLDFTIAE